MGDDTAYATQLQLGSFSWEDERKCYVCIGLWSSSILSKRISNSKNFEKHNDNDDDNNHDDDDDDDKGEVDGKEEEIRVMACTEYDYKQRTKAFILFFCGDYFFLIFHILWIN